MLTFLMFGKYTSHALETITADRTHKAVDLIKELGGEVESMFALLGEKDLAFIVTFPGFEQAMKASIALTRQTGIAFTTLPALEIEAFDRMMDGLI